MPACGRCSRGGGVPSLCFVVSLQVQAGKKVTVLAKTEAGRMHFRCFAAPVPSLFPSNTTCSASSPLLPSPLLSYEPSAPPAARRPPAR